MPTLRFPLLATCILLGSLLQTAHAASDANSLTHVVASRDTEDQTRDGARHPIQTLEFFQLQPGMTVAEVLPGKGWYSLILANYLGGDGALYGVNYADRMWPMFSFATPEFIAKRMASTTQFPELVTTFTDNGIATLGFPFEAVPASTAGTVDRALLIRALHNLNRFEAQAGTRTKALSDLHTMLKDDGMVGVVQHRAPETASDEWADGNRGYLKQASVIAMFEKAGFELVAQSEINANAKDQPSGEDIVWRLPPSLRGSEEDPELKAAMLAIGESDRMTLLFRKSK